MKKLTVLAAVTLFAGCASIVSDSNYPVTLNSTPDGANFKIVNADNGLTVMQGTTPATVSLKSSSGFFDGADYQISFEKEGYNAQSFPLSSSLDGWYIGNIVFGGLIGMLIVDPATGAMWKLDKALAVSLSQIAPPEETLSVITLDQVPANMREHLVPLN